MLSRLVNPKPKFVKHRNRAITTCLLTGPQFGREGIGATRGAPPRLSHPKVGLTYCHMGSEYDVIIIGGGAAGIGAARRLAAQPGSGCPSVADTHEWVPSVRFRPLGADLLAAMGDFRRGGQPAAKMREPIEAKVRPAKPLLPVFCVDAGTVSWYRMSTGAKRNAVDLIEFLSLAGQSPPLRHFNHSSL